MLQPALDADQTEPTKDESTSDHPPADIPVDDTDKSQTPKFVPWDTDLLPGNVSSMLQHQSIIKKAHVRSGKPRTIVPKMPVEVELKEAEITPIVDGDSVVGIKVICQCGATHEIRFEYDEP